MARELPKPKFGDDDAVIDALKEITGMDVVKVQVGTREADGVAIFEEGYQINPDGEYAFRNSIGQPCHVPPHRVHELVPSEAPAPAPEPKPAAKGKGKAAPEAGSEGDPKDGEAK